MSNEKDFFDIRKIIGKVTDYVEKNNHAFIVPEHSLLIVLDDKKLSKLMESCGGNIVGLKQDLEDFFRDFEKIEDTSRIMPTLAYSKSVQTAITSAGMRGVEATSIHLLSSLFIDKESYAFYFLNKNGIVQENFQNCIQNNNSNPDSILVKYSVNLVDMARNGKIDPLIGRQKELERMIQILNKKKGNNPLICGTEGVGKSALVEGLALRIASGDVPESVKGHDIYSLDMGAMIAGTKYRGEFEERLHQAIKELVALPKALVFIDEIHTVIGAGGGSNSSLDAGNILKPYLSRGELQCIGATTYDEYKKHILSDKAFSRRFKKIDLSEPSKEETLEILKGLRKRYEDFHGISFHNDILHDIVELSGRFVIDKFFPDKAIDVMDEIGSKYKSGLNKGKKATKEDVENVICQMANIPSITSGNSEKENLKNLSNNIKSSLFGQDEVVDKIVKQVKISRAGFGNKMKPLAVDFLLGPTGCGKTEFAKQLASNLGIGFLKLDMSEYSEKYSVSKLIGAAPGYIGFEQAGALTEPLIRQPHCVVLFDEIEKADKSVYDLLLQVMDEGKLTDNNGREASFRNAIILMTSNVGCSAADNKSKSVGFQKTKDDDNKDASDVIEKVMKETFSPEFRNRFQGIFHFNNLDLKSMRLIVKKNLKRMNTDLKEQKVEIKMSEKAEKQIAEEAIKENMGGRPVERLMSTYISENLVDEILFGKLENGGKVKIDYDGNKIVHLLE